MKSLYKKITEPNQNNKITTLYNSILTNSHQNQPQLVTGPNLKAALSAKSSWSIPRVPQILSIFYPHDVL